MLYAKIKNGSVVEYPCNLGTLRGAHPNISFPAEPDKAALDVLGYARVEMVDVAKPAPGLRTIEEMPRRVGQTWRQSHRPEAVVPDKTPRAPTETPRVLGVSRG